MRSLFLEKQRVVVGRRWETREDPFWESEPDDGLPLSSDSDLERKEQMWEAGTSK